MAEYKIAHILLSHRESEEPTSDRTRPDALSKAEDALDRIKDGMAFEIIASQVSDCPSGAIGGLLGVVEEGEMVEEFEEVAFKLNEGDVSEVFETEYGYHIAWRYTTELLDEAYKNSEE
ncbi:MAG: peptidylprolyl isomerase [Alphaproteobacteria bacterium]